MVIVNLHGHDMCMHTARVPCNKPALQAAVPCKILASALSKISHVSQIADVCTVCRQASNPFMFQYIVETQKKDDLEGSGPKVILATPSMLQNGLSRKLFEAYAPDPKNAIIIADFAVQGTLAKEVLGNPVEFMTLDGKKVTSITKSSRQNLLTCYIRLVCILRAAHVMCRNDDETGFCAEPLWLSTGKQSLFQQSAQSSLASPYWRPHPGGMGAGWG